MQIAKNIIPLYSQEQIANSKYVFNGKFFLNLLWLVCCTFLTFYLEIEKNKGFDKVAVILSGAFLIYTFVPLNFRKLFLLGLAFLIESYLFGIKISVGVTILILYFVWLTYIKNNMVRLLTVLVSVALGIVITSKYVSMPHIRLMVMLAALFLMLRYIYLLYELNYFKEKPVFIDRLCYLFLIPNVCFPLFPALSPVDYLKSYYDKPSDVSFVRGLNWITIGIIQLLIYRVIYLYFSPSPYDIEEFRNWIWFILSAYSLIFRLSGLFYIATGFLQLFGFNLPNIFNHVYFASGFPDLWRRVNLYWRTFMIRVFYYPIAFKFKKQNQKAVIFWVTLLMFGFTWLLHSWQWYWIKGSYYFYPTDMLFWFTLGIVIAVNAVLSYSKLSDKQTAAVPENYFLKGAKVVVMFIAMSLLWSMWTSSSITEFIYISKFSLKGNAGDYLSFAGVLLVAFLIAGIIRTLHYKRNWFGFVFSEIKPLFGITFCVIVFGSLEALKKNNFYEEAENFISLNINTRDRTLLERGYYEQILNNDDKQIDLMNVGSKFKKWNLDRNAYRKTENELIKEFIPGYKTTFKGDTLYTNSFGMRDKEYPLIKAENTVRLAFVGGSYVMGSGVSNDENFAALIETKMNSSVGKNIEVFNFGAGGYYLIQSTFVVKEKIPEYKPDYLFCFIHSSYKSRCLDNFANLLQKQIPLTMPYLKTIADKAGIQQGMCHLEMYNRLKPFIDDVFKWAFESISATCVNSGIEPVMVYLPANASLKKDNDKEFCLAAAAKEGFHIIDLSEVYEGKDPMSIQLSSWDTHPNEKGHQLISDLLFEKMKKDKQFFKFMN